MTTELPAPPSPPLRRQVTLLRRLFAEPQPVLDELRATCGPVAGLGAGPMRMAVVGSPDALTELFDEPPDSFRWNHPFNVLGFVVGKQSMIVSDGDVHRRRRRSVQSAFSRKRLNRWIPMILERADRAAERAIAEAEATDGPIDLYPVGRELALGVALEAFFGPDLAARADEIGAHMQVAQDYLEAPGVRQLPHPLPFTRRAQVRAALRELDEIIGEAIAVRRRAVEPDPDDVLSVLVVEGELSDGEIRDQVVTLIGAGYDTTAASLAWMLVRAARAPGVWERLHAEASAVLPTDAREADHTALAALTYADQVVHESLRLHPAGVLSPRQAATDVEVAGHRIAKGTLIMWSPHLAGRDADAWDDPLRFDPDRFADDAARPLVAGSWVPFGGGARNCIGFALAQMELTLAVARFAQHLDLEPTTAEVPGPVGMVVNRPIGGVPMLVRAAATG